jgi:hypothetical protein
MSFVEAVLVSMCAVAGSEMTTSVYYQAGERACAINAHLSVCRDAGHAQELQLGST